MFDIPSYSSFKKIEAVNKGWSDDKKYYIETDDGRKLLLRLSDISKYERKKSDFEIMKKVASLNVPMSLPVDFGVCDNNTSVYQLLTWIDGEDAETVLPDLSDIEQYNLGIQSGKALRLIHSIPAPSSQVGQCIASALEIGKGGQLFPVCTHNMTWKEMLAIFHEHMGMPNRKIITIPTFLFKANAKKIAKQQKASGHEGGLDMVKFVKVMTYEAFMSDFNAKTIFRARPDDIKKAIGESVQLCLDVLDKKTDVIDMKGE